MADRRPRRTRVWWLVAEHDGRPIRAYLHEDMAQEYVDTWSDGRGWRVIRVIESPGGRGKRGRKA